MKSLVYASAIRGYTHCINGIECQDSFSYICDEDNEIKVVAVADGHGSSLYYRSKIGSQVAVDVAKEELYSFFLENKSIIDDSVGFIDKERLDKIKENISSKWKKRVYDHLYNNPVSLTKMKLITIDSNLGARDEENKNFLSTPTEQYLFVHEVDDNVDYLQETVTDPIKIYGTTLLASAQYKNHIIILQIGDGNICIVDNYDNLIKPFWNSDRFSIETSSLCQNNSLDFFYGAYFNFDAKFIMLSTDGVMNSILNVLDIDDIARGTYCCIEEEGEQFKNEFDAFLCKFAHDGGDDSTIGFIANYIDDETVKTIEKTDRRIEDAEIEKYYKPIFSFFKFNSDLYPVTVNKAGKETIKFSKFGQYCFSNSFLKEEYGVLIKSLKFKYKAYFKNKSKLKNLYLTEGHINEKQIQQYRLEMKTTLANNPIVIGNNFIDKLSFNENGEMIERIQENNYFFVKEMFDNKICLLNLEKSVYDTLTGDPFKALSFKGLVNLTEKYALKISSLNMELIRRNK